MLDPARLSELQEWIRRLDADPAQPLRPMAALRPYYETFRRRFGPEVLASLDGEALLETLHDHGRRDSLVYWIEFKDDEELPALFGSIAGGSALKFGLYRRKETGLWMTGSPNDQRVLTVEEAVAIARRHRDQLIRGAERLAALPPPPKDPAALDAVYAALQSALDADCPDLSDSAWGHKYFSMLAPERLDAFHSPALQRYHLLRLGILPPAGEGRYLVAGRYVALAEALGLSLNALYTLCNRRNGAPRSYWRIGTTDDSARPGRHWPLMRDTGYAAVGWPGMGDLSASTHDAAGKEAMRQRMRDAYPTDPQTLGRQLQQLFNFRHWVKEGDVVLAASGAQVLGVGLVTGGYVYAEGHEMPHRVPVRWVSTRPWTLETKEGLLRTCSFLVKPATILAIEDQLFAAPAELDRPLETVETRRPDPSFRLDGLGGRIQALLARKGQVILYGPPGTGKTFHAEGVARELAARAAFGVGFAALTPDERAEVVSPRGDGLVRTVCFHPAYGYEDFLEGYRPEVVGGRMVFSLVPGLFKRLCLDAERARGRSFFLIIDELNRGDVPRIFGELLTVLERPRRGSPITLPSGAPFAVPPNVFLIGTMNTADRSIALLDAALRRRFGFVELMPEPERLGAGTLGGIPLGPWLRALNERICAHVGRDARNLQVGHAWLMEAGRPVDDFGRFARVVQEELVPLLEEYCYEDYAALERILGASLVDRAGQRVRHELFSPERAGDLAVALMAPCPLIAAASTATQDAAGAEAESDAGEDLAEA